jgi:hypothetical protein
MSCSTVVQRETIRTGSCREIPRDFHVRSLGVISVDGGVRDTLRSGERLRYDHSLHMCTYYIHTESVGRVEVDAQVA